MKKPVLIDCDGVVADFVGTCLDYAKSVGVEPLSPEQIKMDIKKYDLWKQADLGNAVLREGFCYNIKLIEGAQEFVQAIRDMDIPIMFVTSPYEGSKHWHYERYQWLKTHFNINRKEIMFATEKRYVGGITLIDDKADNVLNWQRYNAPRFGILIAQPWNEKNIKDYCLVENYYQDNKMLWSETEQEYICIEKDWHRILDMINLFNR